MKAFTFRRGRSSQFETPVNQLASYATEPMDLGPNFTDPVAGYIGAIVSALSLGSVTVPGVVLANTSAAMSVTSIVGLAPGQSVTGTAIPAGTTISSLTAGTDNVTLGSVAISNSSTTLTCTSTAGLVVGQEITGTHIPAGTTIASITNGTTLVLSAAAAGSASGSYVATNVVTLSAAATGTASGTYTAANVITHKVQVSSDASSWSDAGSAVAITGTGINYAAASLTARFVRRYVTMAGLSPSITGYSWLDVGGPPGKLITDPNHL